LTGRDKFGLAVVVGLFALRVAAVFIDVGPGTPTDAPLLGPSAEHWFGTDALGRDLLLRVVDSTEAFFGPGLFACFVALLFGVPAGALVGYRPDVAPATVVRFGLTIVAAWPQLVLVIVVVAIFTASVDDPAAWSGFRLYLLAAVLGVSFVPQVAGAVGEKVAWFRRERFVEAAVAHGLTHARILGFHILWANCRNLVLRQACMLFGAFLLVETSLSYLGDYGVPPPRPSWGNILSGLKSQVIHVRSLARPESLAPSDIYEGLLRAVVEGGAVALAAPTLAIVVSIAGVLAAGEYFAGRDER
jgi:ABC-type dipeptide/oligopeptide/nickel transport system permease subunit